MADHEQAQQQQASSTPVQEHSHGLSFDACLLRYVGEFGPAQRRSFMAASLLWIPNALFILLMVFTTKDPIKAHWWNCTNSTDTSCAAVLAMDDPGKSFCDLDSAQWEWTEPGRSIISQFNLICNKAILAQLVNSAFFLGYLIGSGVFGTMADTHGRRKTLLVAQAMATASTLMSALAPDYLVYLFSRILTGIGAAGQSLVTYLIATESIGPSWRGYAGVGTQMFFIVGELVLVLVAFLLQPWRALCIFTLVVGGASLAMLLLLPESPRWLLAKGRKGEAEAIIQEMARLNGTRPPLEPLADPLPPAPAGAAGAPGHHGPVTLRSVLKDRHILRRFAILAYVWCILCMTYYGISLALNALPISLYITFLLASLAEIPSNVAAAWGIERIGRHNTLAAGMLLGGVACLVCSFSKGGAQAFFAAVGKLGVAGAFTVASIYTSELFPTLVRSAVLGLENEAARVGGIAAPFIVQLGTSLNSPALPFLIFGATAVLAGLLIFTLPETLGAAMPDTMKDMEAIQSIFSTGVWKNGWRATRKQLFSTHAHGASHGSTAGAQRLPTVEEEVAQGHSSKDLGKAGAGGALATSAELSPVGVQGGIPAAAAGGALEHPRHEGHHHHEAEHVSLLQPHYAART